MNPSLVTPIESEWKEPLPACDEPCRLSLADVQAERQKVLRELVASAQNVAGIKLHTGDGITTGVRLRFKSRPGLMETLAHLAESEQAACSFLKLKFSVQPNGGLITVDLTGPEGTREALLRLSEAN